MSDQADFLCVVVVRDSEGDPLIIGPFRNGFAALEWRLVHCGYVGDIVPLTSPQDYKAKVIELVKRLYQERDKERPIPQVGGEEATE